MPETKQKLPVQRDNLALVVGGLFILALVFAAYNYFTKSAQKMNDVTQQPPFQQQQNNKAQQEQPGDVDGDGAKDHKAVISQQNSTQTTTTEWVANDYKKGDIKAGSYTVVRGDTLWEIAEAAYGDGTQWVKILNANIGSVGFLPNGQQALIVPGQVLVLP